MMNVLVPLAFAAILASLAAALFFMLKGSGSGSDERGRARNMARALAMRVGFSILLFLCVLLAWKLGWIQPTGIPSGR